MLQNPEPPSSIDAPASIPSAAEAAPPSAASTIDAQAADAQQQPAGGEPDASIEASTSTPTDPWQKLLDAGSDPTLRLLLAGPVSLLILAALIYAMILPIRRRREKRQLDADIAALEGRDTSATPTSVEITPAKTDRHLRLVKDKTSTTATAEPSEVETVRQFATGSWLQKMSEGLAKTRLALTSSLGALFTGRVKLDQETLEKLHEALYRADVGVSTADRLVERVRRELGAADSANWEAVAQILRDESRLILGGPQQPLNIPSTAPWVILVVGVNGAGKTTTIGKLAAHFLAADKSVLLAAGDTFRAAAIEQLSVWGERLGVDVIKQKPGADPAAVAYDAVKAAMARKIDVLLIDTAGRLQNRTELMDELAKINRIIGRDLPGAPHETWLVLDATTGQNAVQQVKIFREVCGVSGLIVTKLDGTAKGGVLVGIADQFKIPIRYVGVGEKAVDLRPFDPSSYANSLL